MFAPRRLHRASPPPQRAWVRAAPLLWLSLGLALLVGARAEAKTYRFGVVPQFARETLEATWRPVLDELTKSTGLEFELVLDNDIAAFEQRLAKGELDFAYCNPYHSLIARQKTKYEPLVRDGGRKLQGILVVRKDSGVTSLKELDGQTLAFPAPNALAASLVIRAHLKRDQKVSAKAVYVKNHDNVYRAVVEGKAKAGGGVMKTLQAQPPEIRDQLTVLYTTTAMAPHPVIAHPSVDKALQQKVQRALLALGDTDAGRTLLAPIPIKKIVAATIADYRPLMWWGLQDFYVEGAD